MPDRIGAHLLGRRPDPHNDRARTLFPASLPPRSDKTDRYWKIPTRLDQGNTGECVGHALAHRWANGPTLHEGIDHAWAEKLYMDATLIDPWPDNDGDPQGGTSGRAACEVLFRRGLISKYTWITNIEDLITAVLDLGSVCVGTTWYNSMFNPVQLYDNYYLQVNPFSGIAGGHEYCVTAVDLTPAVGGPTFFRILNSWGDWGKNGTARISIEDMDMLVFAQGGDAVLIHEA